MSEPIWYFANGDVQRGPVTEAQIRALIGTGNLKPDDLVWKEGMPDWMPAGEVPGLFEPQPASGAAEPNSGREDAAEAARPKTKPGKKRRETPPERPRLPTPAIDLSKAFERLRSVKAPGRALLVTGFVLVVLARGCDSMAHRYAARVQAKAQVAEKQFQDDWDRQRAALERRRQQLLNLPDRTAADREEANTLAEQLIELNRKKQEELEKLRQGEWQDLARAARDAEANEAIWGFWREGMFWFATLIFSFGLFSVGFHGKGAERWLCLVMLAIVVYSLYVDHS